MDCLPLGTLLAIRVGEIEQMRPIMVPLARPSVGSRELAAIEAVLKSGWLGMGPVVRRFEKTVASFVGARHCVAVSSGTAALHLALEAVGVRGAEVIVPSLTFAATVQAILAAAGIPAFADCREDDLSVAVEDVHRDRSPLSPEPPSPALARFTSRLPVTERIASQMLSLPLLAGMTEAQVDHVIDRVATNHQRCDLSA
jgi:dTDP-4-amino-4,6-dideoxygalactose transaminase